MWLRLEAQAPPHMTYRQPNWSIIVPRTCIGCLEACAIPRPAKSDSCSPLSRLNAQIALPPQARRPRSLVPPALPLPPDSSTRAPSPLQVPPRHAPLAQEQRQGPHLQIHRLPPGCQGAGETGYCPAPARLHAEVERPQLSRRCCEAATTADSHASGNYTFR